LLLVAHPAHAKPAWDRVATPAVARPNDNRNPAGRREGGVLFLAIELREATWYPGGATGRPIRVFAFAETGHAPSVPGPMIRVTAGTSVQMRLSNRIDRRAVVYGLQDHDGHADSVVLSPGETRHISVALVSAGTFFYHARTTSGAAVMGRTDDSQLAGALIVDGAGEGPRPHERVLVMTAFDDTVKATGYPDDHFQVFALNGLSWPHTEPTSLSLGDTSTWRVINASGHGHPMHLHGFHFVVESRGSELQDTVFAPDQRRLAVTEFLRTTAAMRISWVATRPGNWLFHCHLIQHIATSLRADRDGRAPTESHTHGEDVMSGLVMAVRVRDTAALRALPTASTARRRLRVVVTEAPAVGGRAPRLSYVLQSGDRPPAADSARRPGSTLELRQGEPTEIVVSNQSRRETSVHWHGLELDSYYDGVAGWSGEGDRLAPVVAPGDSFIARITPPRSGTFIYHTHMDELTQLAGGLFGAFIVLPTGLAHRDTTERLLLFADNGLEPGSETGGSPGSLGVELRAGVAHRVRIISIGTEATYRIRLLHDSTQLTWRPLAKDGADLPPAQAVEGPAFAIMGAGETRDVQILWPRAESLTLELRKDGVTYYRVPVVVR
jgi:FtsP/CotA-like multicopper oxidase with cupredoxin domain